MTQQQVFHFPRRDPAADWPVFVYKGPDAQVYGLPGGRDGGPGGAVKLAEHDGGHVTTADARDFAIDPASRERLRALLATRFLAWSRRRSRRRAALHEHGQRGLPHRPGGPDRGLFAVFRARGQVRAAHRRDRGDPRAGRAHLRPAVSRCARTRSLA
ncbi:hypothetical protein ACFQX7_38465 [Luedemannella flava]